MSLASCWPTNNFASKLSRSQNTIVIEVGNSLGEYVTPSFLVLPACPSPPLFIMSSDIACALTSNTSAYLLKLRGGQKPFSADPLNLTNKNSQRYNGYLHKKAVGVTAGDKGFVLSVKAPSKAKEFCLQVRRKPSHPQASAKFLYRNTKMKNSTL